MGNFSSFVNQDVKTRRRVLLLYKQSELRTDFSHNILEQPLTFNDTYMDRVLGI